MVLVSLSVTPFLAPWELTPPLEFRERAWSAVSMTVFAPSPPLPGQWPSAQFSPWLLQPSLPTPGFPRSSAD